VSFLNQLKSQAKALQNEQSQLQANVEETAAQVERACDFVLHYFQDLARQLNVIVPAAPAFSVDGKAPWPAMKLLDFRVDARKKLLRSREVFDYIGMAWRVVPQVGEPVGGLVSVNFPPDLQRVESRLAMGPVKHERKEIRHPEKNTLLSIEFEYMTETRGNVVASADHDKGQLAFRLMNCSGFGILNTAWAADKVKGEVLDELAKLLVSQPQRFL
jgi:hypothetical protein